MYPSITQSKKQFAFMPSRPKIAKALSVLAVSMVAVYMGLMVKTISMINERKDIRNEIRSTQVAISDLEVKYFDLAQSIDQKTIESLGFTTSTVPTFAYTNPAMPTVAIR